MLRPSDVLASMQERRKLAGVTPVLDERVCPEHRFEPPKGIVSLVSDLGESFEMSTDVTFVPGDEDRLDVREVLVERRTPDARLLGDLRHLHRQQPVLGYQRPGGVQYRVAHLPAVRLYRLVPKLRHDTSIP